MASLAVACLLAAAALTLVAGAPTASAESVPVPAKTVSTALFVAGDLTRLSTVRGEPGELGGLEELVLQKALQQMYADDSVLEPGEAKEYVEDMEDRLANRNPEYPTPTLASLQLMAGNQRILAILAALESPFGSPSKELPKPAKLAVTHLAAVALAGSSDIFAKAESPRFFEPSADERSNLSYSSFAPASVLRETRERAESDTKFGEAWDAIWETASKERVLAHSNATVSNCHELLASKALIDLPALDTLKGEIEATGNCTIEEEPKELAAIFGGAQDTAQAQVCAHGPGQVPIGKQTIPDDKVPVIECEPGGALYEASHAHACTKSQSECNKELNSLRAAAQNRAQIIAEQRDVMDSAAELLRPSEVAAAKLDEKTAQAQGEVSTEENAYLKYEEEQAVRNDVKGALKAAGTVAGAVASFATKDIAGGVSGLINAGFEVYQLVEENVVTKPNGPAETALKDIGHLSKQLAGFQQYTQEAFRALNAQLAQLTAQMAVEDDEIKLELKQEFGALGEKLQNEQETLFELQDEIQTLFSAQTKAELQTTINDSVGWLARTGELLTPSRIQESLVALQKYATEIANGALVNKEFQPYTFQGADIQLTSKKSGEPSELNEAITYLAHFPGEVEPAWLTGEVPSTLANTTFWAEGARAYAQLMLENTSHVSGADVAGLKNLEAEGLTLEKVQSAWSAPFGGGKAANTILDEALGKFERAAGCEPTEAGCMGGGVEGKKSASGLLQESAETFLDNSLKAANGGAAGNPTDVNLWGGATQSVNAKADAAQKYSALDMATGALTCQRQLTQSEIETDVPAAFVNGVRLGFVGPRGSRDKTEAELECGSGTSALGGTITFCNKLKLFHNAETKPFYDGPCDMFQGNPETELKFDESEACHATFGETECNDLAKELRLLEGDELNLIGEIQFYVAALQEEAYEAGLETLKKEAAPAEDLAGAKALVQSYIELGLPQAVSSDPVLEENVEGERAQFLDPEPGSARPLGTELTALIRSWHGRASKALCLFFCGPTLREELAKNEAVLKQDLIDEVAQRSLTWSREIAEKLKPYVEGKAEEFTESGGEAVSEDAPILESTINRLRLTRFVLNESKPLPGAETLAPTGITSTEATLNGEVDPNGAEMESCVFEYGQTEARGHSVACEPTPKPSQTAVPVSAKVTNWEPAGGSFHERLVVKTWGGTIYGADVKVQLGGSGGGGSSASPSVATTGAAAGLRDATLEGTVNPNGKNVTRCQFTVEELVGGLPTGHPHPRNGPMRRRARVRHRANCGYGACHGVPRNRIPLRPDSRKRIGPQHQRTPEHVHDRLWRRPSRRDRTGNPDQKAHCAPARHRQPERDRRH